MFDSHLALPGLVEPLASTKSQNFHKHLRNFVPRLGKFMSVGISIVPRLGNIQASVGFSFRFIFFWKKPKNTKKKSENTEKVEKSEQKFFPRLGRKLSLGSVFKPFCFVSIFSESNQIGSIEVEKMQILILFSHLVPLALMTLALISQPPDGVNWPAIHGSIQIQIQYKPDNLVHPVPFYIAYVLKCILGLS